MTTLEEQKHAFNGRAKSSMQDFLRSKSWVEKVKSIERMNIADRIAKQAMKQKLTERKPHSEPSGE